MCDERNDRKNEEGAVLIEYVMIVGLLTAMILFFLGLLFPSAGDDFETLVNRWGDKIATEIPGEKITPDTEDAYGAD